MIPAGRVGMEAGQRLAPGRRPKLRAKAVIFAGGEGRRLAPLTQATPKSLLQVGGRPLLDHIIVHLRDAGVSDLLLAVHHNWEPLRDQFGDGSRWGVRLDYMVEPSPLGTIGGLSLMKVPPTDPFFVMNGDLLTKADLGAMWRRHTSVNGSPGPAAMTVAIARYPVALPFGEVHVESGRVRGVSEKPFKEFLVNAGIYILDPSSLDFIPRGRRFDATELIRALVAAGREVRTFLVRDYWLDVGRDIDLDRANRDYAEGLLD